MYDIPRAEDILCQGDIFRVDFVFPFILDPVEIHIAREERVIPAREVEDAWRNGTEMVLLPALKASFAVILSNTCDIAGVKDALQFVTLGGILPIETIPTNETRKQCVKNKVIRYHHLRPHEESEFVDSVVHFGMLTQVSFDALQQYIDRRILTLRSPYKESLGHRFGEFSSRVAVEAP